jgi:acyl-CoA oxidase
VSNYFNALKHTVISNPTVMVLWDLFRLYALYTIGSDARTFLTTNALSSESLDRIDNIILDIMSRKIRPHAIKLVDAWAIPDFLLNSALGRYDGKVYETLYDMAHKKNPLNKKTFNVDWRSEEIVLGSGSGWTDSNAKL